MRNSEYALPIGSICSALAYPYTLNKYGLPSMHNSAPSSFIFSQEIVISSSNSERSILNSLLALTKSSMPFPCAWEWKASAKRVTESLSAILM